MALDANIVILILLGLIAILIGWIIWFEIRMHRLLRGKDAKTLEDSILNLLNDLKDLQAARIDIEKYLTNVEQRLRRSIQGIRTVRFNPFKDLGTGSNQSFATAFLDEEGNGVVVSSLYSRDRVSIFSKPLEKHVSTYELTDEEKEAIEKAKPAKVR